MGAYGTPEHLPGQDETSGPFEPILKNGQIPTGKKILIVILGIVFGLLGIVLLIAAGGSQSIAWSLILALGFVALTILYLVKARQMKRGWPFLLVAFAVFIVYIGSYSSTGAEPAPAAQLTAGSSIVSQAAVVESSLPDSSAEDDESAYAEYAYKEVARNPNNYVGKKAKFTGQVVQVQESGLSNVLRINVTKDQYGLWDDAVYVEYQRKDENESRILEDDILTVYGTLNGIKKYTAVLGNEVSIPYLKAERVELQSSEDISSQTPSAASKSSLSKAKYDQIENGMTYEQIEKILGVPGKLVSESGQKGDDYYTETYEWQNEDCSFNIMMVFMGGKLESKSEYGLE